LNKREHTGGGGINSGTLDLPKEEISESSWEIEIAVVGGYPIKHAGNRSSDPGG